MNMKNEIMVKCPDCGDEFHTLSKRNEMEGCTVCEDVFIIQEEDILR